MIGVNFQPGAQQDGSQNGSGRPSSGSGVQEAIRILSLRLPRVVGAQSVAPMPLLTSQGSGGNSRIDSIVNQVMSRMGLPGQPPMPMQPSRAEAGPQFSGAPQSHLPQPAAPWSPAPGFAPRVVVDSPYGQPPRWPGQSGTDADFSGGGGQPPGMFGTLPEHFTPPPPPLPNFQEPIFRRPQQESHGGSERPFEPLF